MQVRKAQIAIVGDSWLGYRSMTCWTCEQRLRQSCSMHDYDEDRTVYAVLTLKQTYCSEAKHRHEASRGLFATAEFLVRLCIPTSSSAVAEIPRDASCLSVISFNSTIRRFECNLLLLVTSAGDLPLRTNNFCSLVFSSSWSSMLAVMNKIHWCLAVYAVNCTVGIVDRTATVNRYSSIIAIFTYSTRIRRPCWRGPRRNIAIMFGMEKTSGASTRRWKQTEDTFTDFDRLYERDKQTDRHHTTA